MHERFVLLGGVDAGVGGVDGADGDGVAVLEGAELFELLGLLEGRGRQGGVAGQEVGAVGVQADVFEGGKPLPAAAWVFLSPSGSVGCVSLLT